MCLLIYHRTEGVLGPHLDGPSWKPSVKFVRMRIAEAARPLPLLLAMFTIMG